MGEGFESELNFRMFYIFFNKIVYDWSDGGISRGF